MIPLEQRPTIGVSGSADISVCGDCAPELAREVGKAIAKNGAVIVTGATTGFPQWAMAGAKEEGGFSVGVSPAGSKEEHITTYAAPTDDMDFIMYTGFGYPMRDILFVRASEAIIIGCGRIGTIHEFTIAFEDNKPIGVLDGCWFTKDVIKNIIDNSHRPAGHVIYDTDPDKLVKRLLKMIEDNRTEAIKKKMGWGD